MAHDPGHIELHDPETDPLATYVLEPDDVRPLLRRVVSSPGAGAFTSHAPFTGSPIAAIPLSTRDDVARAAKSARAAQRLWAARPLRDRTAVLSRVHDLVLERQSDVLDLIQLESGKARVSAFEEVADIALVARHYAARAGRYLAPRRVPGLIPGLTSVRVLRHPVGVVGIVAPWNFPLTLTLGDVLPALVAGNAVILRPDPQTALTSLWAAELLEEAGLPDGLLQVVVGDGPTIGAAVVENVDHVSFTGSTRTGRVVAAQAGERLVPATLELGGKNPMYVAEDVDVEVAAEGAVRACFVGAGQVCVSIERIYVHEDVADEFTAAFVRRTREVRLGSGLDYRSDMGSLTSAAQLATVVEHVEDAVGHGATVLAGAVHRTDLGPWFYEPTILTDVPERGAAGPRGDVRSGREHLPGGVRRRGRRGDERQRPRPERERLDRGHAPRRRDRRAGARRDRERQRGLRRRPGARSGRRRAASARRASAAGTGARASGRRPACRRSRSSTARTASSAPRASACTASSTWARTTWPRVYTEVLRTMKRASASRSAATVRRARGRRGRVDSSLVPS